MRPHRHVHLFQTEPYGTDTPEHLVLRADHGEDWHEWADCGSVAPPDTPCTAWSEASKNQCPKRAAVLLDVTDGMVVGLCGGHLDVHRKRDLRVEWT